MTPAVPSEPPPPYFESMPTLPPELVLSILTFASTSTHLEDPYQRFKWSWTEALRERSRLLRAASLVARDWTLPAQSLLWEVLYVNPSRAQDMLDRGAPVGRFATAEVCFEAEMRDAGRLDPVREVLSRVAGVRTLCTFCVEAESLPLLPYVALPSFAGVTALDIRHSDAGSSPNQTPLNLPFHLTELFLRTPTSPLVVNALLPCVLGTLTHLHINLLRSPGMEREVYTSRSLLEAVAPQLRSLEISHYTNRMGQGIELPAILSRCKLLTSLHLPFDRNLDPNSQLHLAPLRAIPRTVCFLRLQDYFPLWAVTEYLGEQNSGVEHVEISPRPRPIPDSVWHLREQELALERRCGELGVRFSVAEKGQQPI
ncbi:hypothetical protein BCR35DRAFT_310684 [Leucosporidium creatinivorum]|uniref:F-box domain-containing protein n=1 Tax=Leucosporidium creatinivorum TaxID=106004 RepID=A0A1Y2CXS0_9BASI|nr:hypothetical protein BCR35DRAFT_310684 [Leucosporidium creatinivorum]